MKINILETIGKEIEKIANPSGHETYGETVGRRAMTYQLDIADGPPGLDNLLARIRRDGAKTKFEKTIAKQYGIKS